MSASTEIATTGPSQHARLPEKLEYARFLATSGLPPAQYRDRPGNILWATEYGEMLGLRPMAAITGIHVIEGKPTASAALISALVRRAGHRLRVSGDDEKAIVEIVRADDPEFVFRTEWTLTRARTAGLATKDVWKKYPAAMLKARAVSECARDACEEALMGMHYTPEELGADVDAEGTPIRATAVPEPRPADPDWASKPATAHERETGQPETGLALDDAEWSQVITAAVEQRDAEELRNLWRQAKRERPADVELRERIAAASKALTEQPPADPAPAGEDEPVDAELVDDEPPAGPAEQKQHRHMHAIWNKADVTREERLAVTSHLIGRDIESSNDLTVAEADVVIEALRKYDGSSKALYGQVSTWLEEYAARAAAAVPGEQDGAEV